MKFKKFINDVTVMSKIKSVFKWRTTQVLDYFGDKVVIQQNRENPAIFRHKKADGIWHFGKFTDCKICKARK